MNVKKTTYSIILIFLFVVSGGFADTASAKMYYQPELIDIGSKMAHKLGLVPILICKNEKGDIDYLGSNATIGPNGLITNDGDIIINVGVDALAFEGIMLSPGEYIVKEDGKFKKGHNTVQSTSLKINSWQDQKVPGIMITGRIANLDETKTPSFKGAYLQLFKIPQKGSVDATYYKGGLIYISELPKVSLPSDGIFTFKIRKLKAGKYYLIVQPLQNGSEPAQVIAVKDKKPVTIRIPKTVSLPFKLDVGDVQIKK